MIITAVRHGRTRRDVVALQTHLTSQRGQRARILATGALPVSDVAAGFRFMEAMRDGSRARVSMQHLSINPRSHVSPEQALEAVRRILDAYGAHGHPWMLFEHRKARAVEGAADVHFHLVLGHVGPSGRALRDSHSFRRLEAVARSLEWDWGMDFTRSRRAAAVAGELRRMGRPEIAEAVLDMKEKPRSAMSSRRRAAAAKRGIHLPSVQAAVREAWVLSERPQELVERLQGQGLTLEAGDRPGVVLVRSGAALIGALDRIVRQKRSEVAAWMQAAESLATSTPRQARRRRVRKGQEMISRRAPRPRF